MYVIDYEGIICYKLLGNLGDEMLDEWIDVLVVKVEEVQK